MTCAMLCRAVPTLCRWNHPTYRHITAHYTWAFDQLFTCAGYRRVVVLEDDMLAAPDLFTYFEATAKLLDQVGSPDRPSPSYRHHEIRSE